MHSIQKLFGSRVRQLREEQQMGATDVAAHIGCDVSHYYSIERGAHPPSFALLVAIAKTFKVDEADLFTWPGTGVRHDLREQVRLAAPADLTRVRAALAEIDGPLAGEARPSSRRPTRSLDAAVADDSASRDGDGDDATADGAAKSRRKPRR